MSWPPAVAGGPPNKCAIRSMQTNNWKPIRRIILIAMLVGSVAQSASTQQPVKSVPDPGVITTRQMITPAGEQAIFGGRVYAVGFCGKDAEVTVAVGEDGAANVYRLSTSSNAVLGKHSESRQGLGIQGMGCDASTGNVLLALTRKDAGSKKAPQSVLLLNGPGLTAESRMAAEPLTRASVTNQSDAWQTAARLSGTLANG